MDTHDVRAKAGKIVALLVNAVQMESVYGREHNLTKKEIENLYAMLHTSLSGRFDITIGIIGNEVAFEKEPFYEISKNIEKFILRLKDMKIEKISFLKNIERWELAAFIELLSGSRKYHKKTGGVENELKVLNVKNIALGTIGLSEEKKEDPQAADAQMEANASFREGVNFMKQTLDDIGKHKPINIGAARFVVGKIVGSLLKNIHSLLILTSLKKHDEYTFVHSLNVAIFTLAQAEALGLPEALLMDIGIAALLHDVGKLSIQADIIQKSAKLSREDIEKMHAHPADGAEILLEMPNVPLLAAITAFEHHVKYNEQGYPSRLYGDRSNLASMMITIADVYDAMRSERSYHEAFAAEKAHEEMMLLSGKTFNPVLLDAFFKKIGAYPPGTLVELDNGAIGLAVKESIVNSSRPQVEMLYNSKGVEEKETYTINLLEKNEETGLYKWTIAKSIPISDKHNIPDKYKTE